MRLVIIDKLPYVVVNNRLFTCELSKNGVKTIAEIKDKEIPKTSLSLVEAWNVFGIRKNLNKVVSSRQVKNDIPKEDKPTEQPKEDKSKTVGRKKKVNGRNPRVSKK